MKTAWIIGCEKESMKAAILHNVAFCIKIGQGYRERGDRAAAVLYQEGAAAHLRRLLKP